MPVLVRQMREHDEKEEDIFDSSVNLEGSHLQQGFEDGFRDRVVAAKDEGREVGLKTGIQDLVDTICGKCRAIKSMLSIHLDYEGYPKPNLAEDASF
ncbi:unnamed protein product [Sphagnum compactum]